MRGVRLFKAILSGNAVVLVKRDEHSADVLVGKSLNKRFAINSMVGAVKALLV